MAGHGRGHVAGPENVAGHLAQARTRAEAPRRADERGDLVPGGQQAVGQAAAERAGRAEDKDVHDGSPSADRESGAAEDESG